VVGGAVVGGSVVGASVVTTSVVGGGCVTEMVVDVPTDCGAAVGEALLKQAVRLSETRSARPMPTQPTTPGRRLGGRGDGGPQPGCGGRFGGGPQPGVWSGMNAASLA
jgi:hypothetical protein